MVGNLYPYCYGVFMMRDQAETLRLRMLESQREISRSIAIVSGKGGVGKSNFSTNFAYALLSKEKKVIIIDMDIGMGNIHILLGMTPRSSLKDYLIGEKEIEEVINSTPEGLDFISGGSGLDKVLDWSDKMFDRLIIAFEQLQRKYDVILFDMGAGVTRSAIELLVSIDEIIVISTTEPTSITDAYSMMKFICMKDPDKTFNIVSNRVSKDDDGDSAVSRLQFAMRKFMQKETTILGILPEDPVVHKAVLRQKPYLLLYPSAPISKGMMEIATRYLQNESETDRKATIGFLGKLKRMFTKGRV